MEDADGEADVGGRVVEAVAPGVAIVIAAVEVVEIGIPGAIDAPGGVEMGSADVVVDPPLGPPTLGL